MSDKRPCCAITSRHPLDENSEVVIICGAVRGTHEHRDAAPQMVPLCAAHRAMAEVDEITGLFQGTIVKVRN